MNRNYKQICVNQSVIKDNIILNFLIIKKIFHPKEKKEPTFPHF